MLRELLPPEVPVLYEHGKFAFVAETYGLGFSLPVAKASLDVSRTKPPKQQSMHSETNITSNLQVPFGAAPTDH
jgi:hypothetical protein